MNNWTLIFSGFVRTSLKAYNLFYFLLPKRFLFFLVKLSFSIFEAIYGDRPAAAGMDLGLDIPAEFSRKKTHTPDNYIVPRNTRKQDTSPKNAKQTRNASL